MMNVRELLFKIRDAPTNPNELQDLHSNICTDARQPPSTFLFSGLNSGLQLTPIAQWPSDKNSFTFCVWLHLSPKVNKPSRPYICSFRSRGGGGLDFFLEESSNNEYTLVFNCYSKKGIQVASINPGELIIKGNQWHFVSLTLKSSFGIRRKPTAEIGLNGNFLEFPIDYPHLSDPFPSPTIGWCQPQWGQTEAGTHFKGQMGPICFFSPTLTQAKIQSFYQLGPEFNFCFDAPVQDILRAPGAGEPLLIASSLFMGFNPSLVVDNFCLDTQRDSVWRIGKLVDEFRSSGFAFDGLSLTCKMQAKLLEGTKARSNPDISTVLDALGGIRIFFPLIAHLSNYPSALTGKTRSGSTAGAGAAGEGTRAVLTSPSLDAMQENALPRCELLGVAMGVVAGVITRLGPRQRSARTLGDLPLLGHILATADEGALTPRAFNACVAIFEALPPLSAVQFDFLSAVLCNVEIWKNAVGDVQLMVLGWVRSRMAVISLPERKGLWESTAEVESTRMGSLMQSHRDDLAAAFDADQEPRRPSPSSTHDIDDDVATFDEAALAVASSLSTPLSDVDAAMLAETLGISSRAVAKLLARVSSQEAAVDYYFKNRELFDVEDSEASNGVMSSESSSAPGGNEGGSEEERGVAEGDTSRCPATPELAHQAADEQTYVDDGACGNEEESAYSSNPITTEGVGSLPSPTLAVVATTTANVKCRTMTSEEVSERRRDEVAHRRRDAKVQQMICDVRAFLESAGPHPGPPQGSLFWVQDHHEASGRRRPRMLRNPMGSQHEGASSGVGVGPRGRSSSTSDDRGRPSSTSMDDRASISGIAPTISKEMLRYRRQSSGKEQEQVDGDVEQDLDGTMDIGEGVVAASSSSKANATLMSPTTFAAPVEIITVSSNSSGGRTEGTLEIKGFTIVFTCTSPAAPGPGSGSGSGSGSEGGRVAGSEAGGAHGSHEYAWVCRSFPSTSWSVNEVCGMYQRRYLMSPTAIELFFTSRTSTLINFLTPAAARRFYMVVRLCRPPHVQLLANPRPDRAIKQATVPGSTMTLTDAWVKREISNFEYLMALNTIAGRSFNDLGQYPVFPWVIADYKSSQLDLADPKTFRDLKWSMGAQTEARRQESFRRYQDTNDMYESDPEGSMPPFHHGTHYSCMGFVYWFLVRMEPYTSLHIWLQNGRFDKTDRQFFSIESAWEGATSNRSDVKELIPEFFYFPEFLENVNGVDLGKRQTGDQISEVQLPRWCKNAQDFVRLNREALESEYVSKNLHHWIDLIFGYKQRPPTVVGGSDASLKACNVFVHLTYADAVNLEEMKQNDYKLYVSTIRQIDNYGCTPMQLFTERHPKRLSCANSNIVWPLASPVLGVDTIPQGKARPDMPSKIMCFPPHEVSGAPVVFIAVAQSATGAHRLVTIDADLTVGTHALTIKSPDVMPPYSLKTDSGAARAQRERRVGKGLSLIPSILSGVQKEYFISGAVGDISTCPSFANTWEITVPEVKVSEELGQVGMTAPKAGASVPPPTDSLSPHLFAVLPSANAIFSCGHWDNSFRVTMLDTGKLTQIVNEHNDLVTSLALVSDFGSHWLVTGSWDCSVMVWAVQSGADALRLIPSDPLHVLSGHRAPVTCVAADAELDIVLSGSEVGVVLMHALRDGRIIRCFDLLDLSTMSPISRLEIGLGERVQDSVVGGGSSMMPPESDGADGAEQGVPAVTRLRTAGVRMICISCEGMFVAYTSTPHLDSLSSSASSASSSSSSSSSSTGVRLNMLTSHTLNGKLLACTNVAERISCMTMSEDGRVVLTGGSQGAVVMRWVWSLGLAFDGPRQGLQAVVDGNDDGVPPFSCPVRSIHLTKNERLMIVGLENGKMRILAQESGYLRKRLAMDLAALGVANFV